MGMEPKQILLVWVRVDLGVMTSRASPSDAVQCHFKILPKIS